MRKTTAAVLATGAAFAVTAAAASAISVTGPFDPAAGTGTATSCDIGDTSIDSLTDGTDLLGYTVQTSNDTSSDTNCTDATIWIRIDYTDTADTTQSLYATLPADADYTSGTDLNLGDGDFFTDLDLTNPATTIPLADETTTASTVLVTTTPPTNFAPPAPTLTCYDSTTPGQEDAWLVGPISTAHNWQVYLSYDGSCSGGNYFGATMVEAANASAANSLCISLGSYGTISATPYGTLSSFPTLPTNYWMCSGLWF